MRMMLVRPLLVGALIAGCFGGLLSANELHDPTRPGNFSSFSRDYLKEMQAGYRLNAVIFGAERRSAMINGQWVSEGGRIGSTRVEKIERSSVILKVQGTEISIELAGGRKSVNKEVSTGDRL